MKSAAVPLLLAALAGALLATFTHGLTFGLGVRYGLARARPEAYERVLQYGIDKAVALGRRVDSVTTDFAAFKRKACAPRVHLVEVPLWTPPVARPVSRPPAP